MILKYLRTEPGRFCNVGVSSLFTRSTLQRNLTKELFFQTDTKIVNNFLLQADVIHIPVVSKHDGTIHSGPIATATLWRQRRQRRGSRFTRAIFIFLSAFCQNVLSLQIKANLSRVHICIAQHARASVPRRHRRWW